MPWLVAVLYLLGAQQNAPRHPTAFDILAEAEALQCGASDESCLMREFELRGQADQSIRRPGGAQFTCPGEDNSCLSAAWRRVDHSNLSRLVAIVDERGWPALNGEAAMGAWYIAQHADPTPGTWTAAFRERVAPMVLAEVQAGRLAPDTYARMADRNALARGESQPFGTLAKCDGAKFDRTSVTSVDDADTRRRTIGMDILLSESLSYMDGLCAAQVANPGA